MARDRPCDRHAFADLEATRAAFCTNDEIVAVDSEDVSDLHSQHPTPKIENAREQRLEFFLRDGRQAVELA